MEDSRRAGFALTSEFLYGILYRPPEEDDLTRIREASLLQHWPVRSTSAAIMAGLQNTMRYLCGFGPGSLPALRDDFAALFVGPGPLRAAPWGSVYLDREQLTHGASTLALRRFFKDHGLNISTGQNEPEDHIGLLFAVISWMCGREDLPGTSAETVLAELLREHVLPWSGRFLEIMQKEALTDWYRGVAQLARGTLEDLAGDLSVRGRVTRLYR